MKTTRFQNVLFFIVQLEAALLFVLSLGCFAMCALFIRALIIGRISPQDAPYGPAYFLGALTTLAFGIGAFLFHKAIRRHNPSANPGNPSPAEKPAPKKSTPPVWEIVSQNNTAALQAELAKDGDINEPYPANGNTPLHIAAWNGYGDIVQLLLAQPGIDKNAKNLAGKTPLDLAKEQNHTEIAALLEK